MSVSYNTLLYGVVKGVGWIFPPLLLGLVTNLFAATRFIDNDVFRVMTFVCNPTSPFCTPAQKILTMLWIIMIGVFGSCLFAKERRERMAFVASFSVLFWFFQLLAVFLIMIVDLLINGVAR